MAAFDKNTRETKYEKKNKVTICCANRKFMSERFWPQTKKFGSLLQTKKFKQILAHKKQQQQQQK